MRVATPLFLAVLACACGRAPAESARAPIRSPLPSASTALALQAGAERDLTAQIARSLQLGSQTQVHLATDGTDYLACWVDSALGAVEATRLAADATVLDSPPLSLLGPGAQDCDVAFDGTQYVVSGTLVSSSDLSLSNAVQRVGTDGTLVGAPIAIAAVASQYTESTPTTFLACSQGLCEVEWTDMIPPPGSGQYTYDVWAQLVDTTAGALFGAAQLVTSTTNNTDYRAAKPATNGASFLIGVAATTNSSGGVASAIATFDGGVGALAVDCSTGNFGGADTIAGAGRPDGGYYFLFMQSDYAVTQNAFSLAGSRVDGEGNFLDGCTSFLETPPEYTDDFYPKLTWSGTDWLGTYAQRQLDNSYELTFAHISDATNAITSEGAPVALPAYSIFDGLDVRAACASSGCMMAWADGREAELTDDAARVARIGADGGTPDGPGELIALGANGQRRPAVAWDGQRYFVAWADFRGGDLDIYAAHVSPDGTIVEPTGILVGGGPLDQDNPAVACSSEQCLVAWTNQTSTTQIYTRDVHVARVLPDGGLVDPDGGAIIATGETTQYGGPVAGSLNGDFLVAYYTNSGLFGRVISGANGPAASSIQLTSGSSSDSSLAASSSEYLLTWSAFPEIRAERIAADGGLIDSSPIDVDDPGNSYTYTKAASDGTDFFVNWAGGTGGVQGRVFPGDGGPLGPVGTFDPNAYQVYGAARVSDGWLVAWVGAPAPDAGSGIATAELGADGGVFNAQLAAAPIGGVYPAAPALASNGTNALLLYERPDPVAGNVRVHEQVLSSGALQGAACASDGDCSTLHCADGVCCDTECGGSDPTDCQACAVSAGAATDGTCAPIAQALAHVCRADAGPCDVAEQCDGVGTACPADGFLPSTTICRAANGICDAPEFCPGDAGTCPPDLPVANGTACSGSNLCFHAYACQGFNCAASDPVVCTASDACHTAGICASATGVCSNPSAADGTSCDDGNACTQTSACSSGVCVGSDPIACAVPAACREAGVCSSDTGACSYAISPDRTPCDDGDLCTTNDLCTAGTCAGTKVVCAAADECHLAGACSPTSGQCSNPAVADGTACSQGSCAKGVCVAAAKGGCASAEAGWAALFALAAFGAMGRRRRRAR